MSKRDLAGKITSLSKEKRFGFIQPMTGGDDVFFHQTTLEGDFDNLQIGEKVTYQADLNAKKPRAKKVERLDSARRTSAQRNRRSKPKPDHGPRTPLASIGAAELGFITKLRKNEKLGFISADAGGPELLFGMENVSGIRPFAELSVGDSVRFLRSPNTEEVGPPLASAVEYAQRPPKKSGLDLPPNPRARRKKPTWRR